MSTYFVTFRIADETISGQSYAKRRQSIIDAIYNKQGYWEETTSFVIAVSTLDTKSFATKASAGLCVKNDILVAFDPEDMSMAYFGPVEFPNALASFFETTTKLQ